MKSVRSILTHGRLFVHICRSWNSKHWPGSSRSRSNSWPINRLCWLEFRFCTLRFRMTHRRILSTCTVIKLLLWWCLRLRNRRWCKGRLRLIRWLSLRLRNRGRLHASWSRTRWCRTWTRSWLCLNGFRLRSCYFRSRSMSLWNNRLFC